MSNEEDASDSLYMSGEIAAGQVLPECTKLHEAGSRLELKCGLQRWDQRLLDVVVMGYTPV